MFKKVFFCLSIFFLVSAGQVLAVETAEIALEASRTEVTIGDSFQISVRLKNASTGNLKLGSLKIPGLENFTQQGSSQSSQIQIINGTTRSINETILTLVAKSEGVFNVGPIAIDSNILKIESNVLEISVKEPTKKSFFDNSADDESDKALGGTSKSNIKTTLLNIFAFALLVFFLLSLYKRKQDEKDNLKNTRSNDVAEAGANKISVPSLDDEKFYIKTKAEILQFLHKKYGVETEVMTSHEVLRKLKLKKVYQQDEIEQAISLCDQGSFAKNDLIKNELLEIIKKIK